MEFKSDKCEVKTEQDNIVTECNRTERLKGAGTEFHKCSGTDGHGGEEWPNP